MAESRRATVYLEPHLHRALKLKAAQSEQSISDLVNQAVRGALVEDAIDLDAVAQRKDHAERDFSSFVRGLRKDGLI